MLCNSLIFIFKEGKHSASIFISEYTEKVRELQAFPQFPDQIFDGIPQARTADFSFSMLSCFRANDECTYRFSVVFTSV